MLLTSINKLLQNKLIRFFLVSGMNTIFGFGLFALFIFAGLPYPIALLISTIVGIFFNFKTTGLLVFKSSNNILVYRFFGVYGTTYICNLGGLALLKWIGINMYWGGAILLIPVGLLAFILNKYFVFN